MPTRCVPVPTLSYRPNRTVPSPRWDQSAVTGCGIQLRRRYFHRSTIEVRTFWLRRHHCSTFRDVSFRNRLFPVPFSTRAKRSPNLAKSPGNAIDAAMRECVAAPSVHQSPFMPECEQPRLHQICCRLLRNARSRMAPRMLGPHSHSAKLRTGSRTGVRLME